MEHNTGTAKATRYMGMLQRRLDWVTVRAILKEDTGHACSFDLAEAKALRWAISELHKCYPATDPYYAIADVQVLAASAE